MIDLIIIIVFIWLSIKLVGLALKLTWGVAKIAASLLFVVALPTLIGCVLFASGVLLLLPVLLVIVAIVIANNAL